MPTEESADPLDEIVVNGNANLDRGLLTSILKGRIGINQSGRPVYTDSFYNYPDWKKIVLSMLARKASVIKQFDPNLKEAMSSKEICQDSMVSPDNLSRRLSRELKSVVEKTPQGYVVPNYRLIKCKDILAGDTDERS